MAGYVDFLNTQSADPYLDTDINWKQFIRDHKSYLRSISPRIFPTNEIIAANRYDIKRWLRHEGYTPSSWWIILCLNDLSSDIDFVMDNVFTSLYVPRVDQLTTLYRLYLTTSQNRVDQPIGQ